MTTWIALLRGINVSGRHTVPVTQLRALQERLGHTDVVTDIQSGNVVFEIEEASPERLARDIEAAVLERRLGVSSTIRNWRTVGTLVELSARR